jgi:hypothetical protein
MLVKKIKNEKQKISKILVNIMKATSACDISTIRNTKTSYTFCCCSILIHSWTHTLTYPAFMIFTKCHSTLHGLGPTLYLDGCI